MMELVKSCKFDAIDAILAEQTELKNVCACPELSRAHAAKPKQHYGKMA